MIRRPTIKLKPFIQGQTIPDIRFELNETVAKKKFPIDLTDASVIIYITDFRQRIVKTLTTGNGRVSVSNNIITIKSCELNLYPGYYNSDASIILKSRRRITNIFKVQWLFLSNEDFT